MVNLELVTLLKRRKNMRIRDAFKLGLTWGLIIFIYALLLAFLKFIAEYRTKIFSHRYDPPDGMMF